MAFNKFEDIEAWKQARTLMNTIKLFRKRSEAARDWSWSDQIGRSTLSIMANIAEGNDASSDAEFMRFLSYAKRSSAETRSHLYYGLDQKYLTKDELNTACIQSKKISAMLSKLLSYLHQNNRKNEQRSTSNLKI